MRKKTYALFCALMALLAAAVVSMKKVSGGVEYVAAAQGQGLYRLEAAGSRGTIYDCRLRPLTGGAQKRVAAAAPGIEAIGKLDKATGGRYRSRLAAALKDGKPFLFELPSDVAPGDISDDCITLFTVTERYSENQLAAHVVGYLDSLNQGASGAELAMNDVLAAASGEAAVIYQVDALGHAMPGGEITVTDTLETSRAGAALTIDSDIQALAERAGAVLPTGAVVITEVPGCEIRAAASFPGFSPLDLASASKRDDAPLINRAFSAYAPGSVFKLVPAAAELDSGSVLKSYNCTGETNAGGLSFRCYDGLPHGTVDLTGALKSSCNCYFINASRALGGQSVLSMAYNLGFGSELEFGRGLFTAPGALPSAEELENSRALANFAFGQGNTSATPVQLCGMMNAIAADGMYSTPKLILGTVSAGGELTESRRVTDRTIQVMKRSTAGFLRNALEETVKCGTAKAGAPDNCAAGAKTGTAQTGAYDENGEELLNFWYCGYVCDSAGAPRYSITVLCDNTPDDHSAAACAFKAVAEGLYEMMEEAG